MKKRCDNFVRHIDAKGLPVEAFSVYVDDKPVFLHRWVPARPRNIYSHTKAFLSTAVGMAVADGLLSLDTHVADIFPAQLERAADAAAQAITLRHLLTMSSGFGEAFLMSPDRQAGRFVEDYMAFLLAQPVRTPPGSAFCYSNGDSYLAGRMVEAVTGETLHAYLSRRLFAPLSIADPVWETDPQGHTFGASGLKLDIEDMLKLGRLYLLEGRWQGVPLVDPAWIHAATARQIDTPNPEQNPWRIGYGYQFWRSPYPDAYRADGMYGQITTVLPQAGAVVAIQCAESDCFGAIQAALDEEVLSKL